MNYKIKKEFMTDNIIREIMNIDKQYYKENYTLQWYKDRYNKNNIAFCLYDEEKIIGYIVGAGIKKELYDDIKKGKYDNDYNIDSHLYDYKSKFIYISSINILEQYRKKGLGTKLLCELLTYYKNNIIAITVSKGGYNLAKRKMNHIMNVDKGIDIFEIK